MKRALLAAFVSTTVLAFGVCASCRNGEYERPCGQLPDVTACPVRGGGTCADETCAAIYSCRDGTWVLRETCSSDGGPRDADPWDAKPDAPLCGDAAVLDGAVSTCEPLLEPDCDWAIAANCPTMACSGGCDGFLRCTKDGWSAGYVAYCDEDGQLVIVEP